MLKMKEGKKQEAGNGAATHGKINGHQYVDLGLPSGLKWATCNLGASSPGEFGYYYAWGETRPKSTYDRENSLTYPKNNSALRSSGIINPAGELTKTYDAASYNWGGSWRMPTDQEFQELIDNCKWAWKYYDGHMGFYITGPNGNWIFLPAAGLYEGTVLYSENRTGYYFSGSIYKDYGFEIPSTLVFQESDYSMTPGGEAQSCGCSIRPVSQ